MNDDARHVERAASRGRSKGRRRRTVRAVARIASVAAAAAAGFALVTLAALESGGVAVVETRAGDGSTRATHVWFVEEPRADGRTALWLEAGTPENPWFVDVQWQPELVLVADDRARAGYAAVPIRDADTQRRVRALLREKYGWRDWWVGLFVDATGTIPIRLEPIGAE